MKKLLIFILLSIINPSSLFAQQKNFVKVNVGDCVNCTNTLHSILQKDPWLTFVIKDEYLLDSNDVIERFNLESHRNQIIWSNKLYDSLSKDFSSELIQFCGNEEVNRSGLKAFKFINVKNCGTQNTFCFKNLSNHLVFSDYKAYLLLTNYISNQQYVYVKKENKLIKVDIDSEMVKSVYIDFLKDPKLYSLYMYMTTVAALFKPKISCICPLNDSTLLGSLITYKVISMTSIDTVFAQMYSLVKISTKGKNKTEFLNDKIPNPYNHINPNDLGIYKGNICYGLLWDNDELIADKGVFKRLARFKKQKKSYRLDKVYAATLDDYLITNKIFGNYNKTYFDNGYCLASLSNYILNLETEEKIYLPLPDAFFKNIAINPKTKAINYYVLGFKYNEQEHLFYIHYDYNNHAYLASFRANAKTFETNDILYDTESPFSYGIKNICLSWDGKSLLYSIKNEECFQYASVAQIQETAKNYAERTKNKHL